MLRRVVVRSAVLLLAGSALAVLRGLELLDPLFFLPYGCMAWITVTAVPAVAVSGAASLALRLAALGVLGAGLTITLSAVGLLLVNHLNGFERWVLPPRSILALTIVMSLLGSALLGAVSACLYQHGWTMTRIERRLRLAALALLLLLFTAPRWLPDRVQAQLTTANLLLLGGLLCAHLLLLTMVLLRLACRPQFLSTSDSQESGSRRRGP